MSDRSDPISRRDTLRLALGASAGLALRPFDLWAQQAGPVNRDATSLVTKPIPSSGERLPVIGIGTARRYDVAASDAELAPLQEVRNFTRMGGKLIDTAPMAALVDAS